MKSIFSFSIIMTLLLLSSCIPVQQQVGPVVLILNFSSSTSQQIESEEAKRIINLVIALAKPGPLKVYVVSKNPIVISYISSTQLNDETIMNDIYKERKRQRKIEKISVADLSLPERKMGSDIWGFGTDHLSTFKRILEDRVPSVPILIVGITDGENEANPWDGIDTTIKCIYEGGPTRIILVGVSQRVIEEATKTTVYDRWISFFKEAGAKDVQYWPSASRGYFLTSTLSISGDILTIPPTNPKGEKEGDKQ